MSDKKQVYLQVLIISLTFMRPMQIRSALVSLYG